MPAIPYNRTVPANKETYFVARWLAARPNSSGGTMTDAEWIVADLDTIVLQVLARGEKKLTAVAAVDDGAWS